LAPDRLPPIDMHALSFGVTKRLTAAFLAIASNARIGDGSSAYSRVN